MWLVFMKKKSWILLKWYNSHKYLDIWTKNGLHVRIWLGNNQSNFQLHRFTMSENIAESFLRGAAFLTHTVHLNTDALSFKTYEIYSYMTLHRCEIWKYTTKKRSRLTSCAVQQLQHTVYPCSFSKFTSNSLIFFLTATTFQHSSQPYCHHLHRGWQINCVVLCVAFFTQITTALCLGQRKHCMMPSILVL